MSKISLNIDTDLDKQIEKCKELIKKYEELEEHAKKLHFATIKDVADMMRLLNKDCSRFV